MAYTIIKTNGTVLTTIADGTVNNTSSSLELPGRNYAGYGVVMDTNFVHLLENFSNSTVPPNPLKGQLWFNSATQELYVCPTDGETNANNWFKILTANENNISLTNLTLSDDLYANNAYITNDITANSVTADYVQVSANANLLGTSAISTILSNSITAGITTATLNGNWNATGNLSVNIVKSDNYRYANNSPIPIYNIAGTNYEIQYNLSGDFGASSALAFNPSTNVLTVNGNVDATQFIGNGVGLTDIAAANLSGTIAPGVQSTITTLGSLTNLTVTNTATIGNINVSGNITAGNITGSINTGAQPNITSLGTLTGLTSTGIVNFVAASNIILGTATDLHIYGGSANYLLTTDGLGNVSWQDPLTVTTAANGSNRQVQYNNDGVLGASANFTFNNATNILTINGNISSGNANLGNTAQANYFVGDGYYLANIRGANIIGQAPNAIVAGTVYTGAQPNITSVGTLTGVTATGNISTSNYFVGNGYYLTYVNAVTSLTANTVVDNGQPNITSVGTLSSLSVTGTTLIGGLTLPISGSNFKTGIRFAGSTTEGGLAFRPVNDTANTISIYNSSGTRVGHISQTTSNATWNGLVVGANVTGEVPFAAVANSVAGANVSGQVGFAAVANSVAGANVSGQVSLAGTVTVNAQPNITSVGTLGNLVVSGNVSASYFTGNGSQLTSVIPSGVIVMWSGSIGSIPSGWYLCNGSNGTPDLRDRFVVGAGSSYSVGGTGGSADAIVVSHTHTATDSGHTHPYLTPGDNTYGILGGTGAPTQRYISSTGVGQASITVAPTGSSGTGANMPPYYALAYIMKA